MKKAIVILFLAFLCQNIFSAEYTYNTSQTTDLKNKLNGKLAAGDIVYLEDGTYNNLQLTFIGKGTASKLITLKAKNPGNVILTGGISIKMSGSYLVVDGLTLKDGMSATGADIIEFRTSSTAFANNCRLTNTVIDNCNNPDESYRDNADKSERWVMLYGKNNRIDHCYFTNKINGGVLIMANINAVESRENNHLIDYNYFSHRPRFDQGNNAEIIRTGDSQTSQYSCKTTIENNFFYACDGEVEIISLKSCDNIVRKNVFYESEGGVVCRHGHRNTIESNAFIGNNKKSCGGVRIINEGHKVYNNYFQDLPGTGSRSALCVMTALFETPTSSTDFVKEPLNTYHRVKNVDIAYNTFVNCANIDLGTVTSFTYPSSSPYAEQTIKGTLKPQCNIARNIFYNTSVNNILNQVSPNTSEINFSNNIYRFKKDVSITGFTSRTLDYVKTTDERGKGIYVLQNSESNILDAPTSAIDFSYVSTDISGTTRLSNKNMGALEYPNRSLPFITVKPSDCGVKWYRPLENDINTVKSKTDFWENPSSITTENTDQSYIQIIGGNNGVYKITSDSFISDVYIYNLSENISSINKLNDTTGSIDCSHLSSGVYLFQIHLPQEGIVTKKIFIK